MSRRLDEESLELVGRADRDRLEAGCPELVGDGAPFVERKCDDDGGTGHVVLSGACVRDGTSSRLSRPTRLTRDRVR